MGGTPSGPCHATLSILLSILPPRLALETAGPSSLSISSTIFPILVMSLATSYVPNPRMRLESRETGGHGVARESSVPHRGVLQIDAGRRRGSAGGDAGTALDGHLGEHVMWEELPRLLLLLVLVSQGRGLPGVSWEPRHYRMPRNQCCRCGVKPWSYGRGCSARAQ
jgi:hypothetical protein